MSYSTEVERALLVCLEAHYGQFRKGGEGIHYSVHPIHMALILARAGVRHQLVQAVVHSQRFRAENGPPPACRFTGSEGPHGRRCDSAWTRRTLDWEPAHRRFIDWVDDPTG